MERQGAKLVRVLAVAAAAAMLISAIPGSVATAKVAPCKVYNLDKGIGRNTLQRAVWDADPGDSLMVLGTCVGTTIVRKDLEIGWVETSGRPLGKGKAVSVKPRIQSGSWRPALVIHPSVEDFHVWPGLPVVGGIVIGDHQAWQGNARPVPIAWKSAAPSPIATKARPGLRACHVRNDSGAQFLRSQVAVRAASRGDHLSLRGACGGATYIRQDLSMAGWRVAISAKVFGSSRTSRKDSGPPTLTRVIVDDDVDSLVLKRVRVTNGFTIREVGP